MANLSPRAGALIAQVAARIRSTPHLTGLRIDGYTDSIGSQSYNIPLSNRRAAAVAAALRGALGSGAPQMSVAGHGADSPAAPNTKPGGSDNPSGRALNRRVEVSYAD